MGIFCRNRNRSHFFLFKWQKVAIEMEKKGNKNVVVISVKKKCTLGDDDRLKLVKLLLFAVLNFKFSVCQF